MDFFDTPCYKKTTTQHKAYQTEHNHVLPSNTSKKERTLGTLLQESNKTFFVGFFTGPLVILIGTAQVVVNLVATFFTLLPSLFCCIKKESNCHVCVALQTAVHGFCGILNGIFMTCPFTSFISRYSKPV